MKDFFNARDRLKGGGKEYAIYRLDALEEYEARRGKTGVEVVIAAGVALALAIVVIFPMLYFLTQVEHP